MDLANITMNITNFTIGIYEQLPEKHSLTFGLKEAVWFAFGMMSMVVITEAQKMIEDYLDLRQRRKIDGWIGKKVEK